MALIEASFAASETTSPKITARLSVKNVLFATDFSPNSEAALPYAIAICRHFGSTLHAAHVLSDTGLLLMTGGVDYVSMGTLYEDAHAEAKEKLDAMSEALEVPHRNYVRHGLVWRNLSIIIEENDIDLIVLGTHGRTGLGKLLLGSVAEDILRHAGCPVLTVGPKIEGRAKLPKVSSGARDLAPVDLDLRQIVFATNFAKNSALVAQEAVGLAEEFQSRLTLVHVLENYAGLGRNPGPIEDALRRMEELLPSKLSLQYVLEKLVEFGSAPERILHVAHSREADMIVLGARRSSDVGSTHLPWSSAHQVIAQAHCPVLTVRE